MKALHLQEFPDLEKEIASALKAGTTPIATTVPIISTRMPTRLPENDLGRMSAEAVLTQYEAAAKAVEDMGEEVRNRIEKLEDSLKDCDATMKALAEAAQAIREKGRLVQVQIEEASALSTDIRSKCEEFKQKVGV